VGDALSTLCWLTLAISSANAGHSAATRRVPSQIGIKSSGSASKQQAQQQRQHAPAAANIGTCCCPLLQQGPLLINHCMWCWSSSG